jgi:hypothetical protein
MRHLIVTLLLVSVASLCSAEIYKWVDDKGQTGYSDDLGKVPAKYRDRVVLTEKEEQAVEIVEKAEPEKASRKGGEAKGDQDKAASGKDKDKPLFAGKTGEAWKQDFARQKYEIKSLEDQAVGIRERMADGSKVSRGEYVTLENTQRDLNVRIEKAKKKLDALNEAAENAGVPGEFR